MLVLMSMFMFSKLFLLLVLSFYLSLFSSPIAVPISIPVSAFITVTGTFVVAVCVQVFSSLHGFAPVRVAAIVLFLFLCLFVFLATNTCVK